MGGCYAREYIDLSSLKERELCKWFFVAILYGAPISEKIAYHTFQISLALRFYSLAKLLKKGWESLVPFLDEGKYVQYDFKTATKLLEIAQSLHRIIREK